MVRRRAGWGCRLDQHCRAWLPIARCPSRQQSSRQLTSPPAGRPLFRVPGTCRERQRRARCELPGLEHSNWTDWQQTTAGQQVQDMQLSAKAAMLHSLGKYCTDAHQTNTVMINTMAATAEGRLAVAGGDNSQRSACMRMCGHKAGPAARRLVSWAFPHCQRLLIQPPVASAQHSQNRKTLQGREGRQAVCWGQVRAAAG